MWNGSVCALAQHQAGARLLALEAAPAGDVEAGNHAVAGRHVLHARAHRLDRPHELRAHASTLGISSVFCEHFLHSVC